MTKHVNKLFGWPAMVGIALLLNRECMSQQPSECITYGSSVDCVYSNEFATGEADGYGTLVCETNTWDYFTGEVYEATVTAPTTTTQLPIYGGSCDSEQQDDSQNVPITIYGTPFCDGGGIILNSVNLETWVTCIGYVPDGTFCPDSCETEWAKGHQRNLDLIVKRPQQLSEGRHGNAMRESPWEKYAWLVVFVSLVAFNIGGLCTYEAESGSNVCRQLWDCIIHYRRGKDC